MRRLATLLLTIPLPLAAQAAGGAGAPPSTTGTPAATAMATIPAGRYLPLYSPDTAEVRVESFRLDRHPVTRAQYASFVEANPRWRRSQVKPVFADRRYLADWAGDLQPGGDPESPVTGVSWFAARAYCQAVDRRLPTVDEWEYVARAGETDANAMADPAHKRRVLRLTTGRNGATPAVKSTFRNLYGVWDMHGLVWEWVRDFNTVTVGTDSRGTDQRDPDLFCASSAEGATDNENYAAFLRYAFRASLDGRSTASSLGFRCAANLQEGGD